MDTRLTFRDYQNSIKTDGGTQTVSLVAKWLQSQVKGDSDRQIRRVVCQENPLRRVRRLYHKRTHVDEMSILRRSGDELLRN